MEEGNEKSKDENERRAFNVLNNGTGIAGEEAARQQRALVVLLANTRTISL